VAVPGRSRGALGRTADVLFALTRADVRVRYGRGRFRLIKWLVDPFALVGVYLLLVTFVLGRPGEAPGLSLTCAVVPFQLLMMSVANALSAIEHRRQIVLNMAFRRSLIPISSVLTESVAFGASLTLFVLMMAVYAVPPTLALLWLPVVLAVNVVVGIAFAYPASLVGLWFPDLRQFAISVVRTAYFVAPGLVPLSAIHGRTAELVRANPMTGLFESYRDVFLRGHSPAAWELLLPLGIALLLLAVFVPLYRTEQAQFAKVLE
jgi:lipopolysaccharide transport system permease protein